MPRAGPLTLTQSFTFQMVLCSCCPCPSPVINLCVPGLCRRIMQARWIRTSCTVTSIRLFGTRWAELCSSASPWVLWLVRWYDSPQVTFCPKHCPYVKWPSGRGTPGWRAMLAILCPQPQLAWLRQEAVSDGIRGQICSIVLTCQATAVSSSLPSSHGCYFLLRPSWSLPPFRVTLRADPLAAERFLPVHIQDSRPPGWGC